MLLVLGSLGFDGISVLLRKQRSARGSTLRERCARQGSVVTGIQSTRWSKIIGVMLVGCSFDLVGCACQDEGTVRVTRGALLREVREYFPSAIFLCAVSTRDRHYELITVWGFRNLEGILVELDNNDRVVSIGVFHDLSRGARIYEGVVTRATPEDRKDGAPGVLAAGMTRDAALAVAREGGVKIPLVTMAVGPYLWIPVGGHYDTEGYMTNEADQVVAMSWSLPGESRDGARRLKGVFLVKYGGTRLRFFKQKVRPEEAGAEIPVKRRWHYRIH